MTSIAVHNVLKEPADVEMEDANLDGACGIPNPFDLHNHLISRGKEEV